MKKFKRILAVVISLIMMMSFASCSFLEEEAVDVTNENIKIGVLLSGNRDTATGMTGTANSAINELVGIEYGISIERFKFAENIDPNDSAAVADALKSLINYECVLIIATENAYLDDVKAVAGDNAGIKFFVADAQTKADGENIYGYTADITDTVYLTGMVAAMKAQELKVPQIGFVAQSQDDISALNAFAMGAKAADPQVKVSVAYGDDAAANTNKLIKEGCVVIASDFESEDLAKTATEANVFFCGFSSGTFSRDVEESEDTAKISYSDYFLCAPVYNFTQYYISAIKAVVDDKEPAPFEGGYAEGSVSITDLNEKTVANGTQEAVDKAAADMADGKLAIEINAENLYDNITVIK